MNKKYVPNVREASVPEGGSWVEIKDGWALAIFISEWEDLGIRSSEGFRYVWMYDRVEDAYLFSFKLHDQYEKAIVFPHDHAGLLLKDDKALSPFSIIISTDKYTSRKESYLHLEGIELKRHPQAGW